MGELVPVIFNKASSPQHHLIRHLIEYENSLVRAAEKQTFGLKLRASLGWGTVCTALFPSRRWRGSIFTYVHTPI